MEGAPYGRLPQDDLVRLAEQWEPEASASYPDFRQATCVVCGEPMTRMWHHWIREGGFKKELHLCVQCGLERGLDKTLIVVAAKDASFADNLPTFKGGDVVVADTSAGGHPSQAYIDTYRSHPDYSSYLFIQDSMRGTTDDVVAPFRGKGPVVAWVGFGMFFDDDEQARWVHAQYKGVTTPKDGIFGPIFYATREALETTEPWFPERPDCKMLAQGTERAWAFAFAAAEVPVEFMYEYDPSQIAPGKYPPFSKVFANRQ